jgi:hypothetical protein
LAFNGNSLQDNKELSFMKHGIMQELNMLLISNITSYMLRKKLVKGFVSSKQLEIRGYIAIASNVSAPINYSTRGSARKT